MTNNQKITHTFVFTLSFLLSVIFSSHFYNIKLDVRETNIASVKLPDVVMELPFGMFRLTKNSGVSNQYSIQNNNLGKYVPITGNTAQLKYFFDVLKETGKKRVRVGYYGDSIILGDVISEYVRQYLQEKFGGNGIGFVPIIAQDIKMRQSVYHDFSNDWNSVSIVTRNPQRLPYGISGNVAIPAPDSWVKYQTTNYLRSTRSFESARIFYNNADESSTIECTLNGSSQSIINFKNGSSINQSAINSRVPITSLLMKFISGKKPYIYGVSLESNTGLYVDNFSMPGNSGVSLLDLDDNMLRSFDKLMNYKLLIFNYGANVTSPNKGIYTVYESKMVEVINKYKRLFPDCSIILISVEDKTMKIGSRFVTNPDVPIILEAQKRIAEKTNIAFWNLWEAMGGENSMYKWVTAAPPMALRDYAHFTPEGGERIASLFVKALLDQYSQF